MLYSHLVPVTENTMCVCTRVCVHARVCMNVVCVCVYGGIFAFSTRSRSPGKELTPLADRIFLLGRVGESATAEFVLWGVGFSREFC